MLRRSLDAPNGRAIRPRKDARRDRANARETSTARAQTSRDGTALPGQYPRSLPIWRSRSRFAESWIKSTARSAPRRFQLGQRWARPGRVRHDLGFDRTGRRARDVDDHRREWTGPRGGSFAGRGRQGSKGRRDRSGDNRRRVSRVTDIQQKYVLCRQSRVSGGTERV
jgi:hypothetical protein